MTSKKTTQTLPANSKLAETFALTTPNDPTFKISKELAAEITDDDFDGYSEESQTLPIVEIRQKELRGDDKKVIYPMGGIGIYDPVGGDGPPPKDLNEITVSILADQPARVFFAKIGAGEKPACQSGDAIVGVGDPGGVCDTCYLNRFAKRKEGDQPLPEKYCKEQRMVLSRDVSGLCYILRFGPSALKPYGSLKAIIKRQNISTAAAIVRMTTEFRDDKGQYYVPIFTVIGTVSDLENSKEVWAEIKELRKEAKRYFVKSFDASVADDDKPASTNSELPPGATSINPGDTGDRPTDDDLPF